MRQSINTAIYLNSSLLIILIILFGSASCDEIKCFKNSPFKDGPITVLEFPNLIDKVLQSDEYLIVAGLNDVYLIDQYDLGNCLSKSQLYNKSTDLDPQNTNKVLVELDKDVNKFLICNTMNENGCSIFYLEHGHLSVDKNNFNFNFNFDLKFCSISKLSHETQFLIACEPDRKRRPKNPIVLGKLKFDEDRNVFQLSKNKDKKSMVSLNKRLFDIRLDLVYSFDQLIVGNKDRFYYGYVLKRERFNGQRLVSKLGRVCLGDHSFRSYTEIVLQCKDPATDHELAFAQSAHLGYAYSNLHKDTLYVAFGSYDEQRTTLDESKGTILCAFNTDRIDTFFNDVIRKCNTGNSSSVRLMTHYLTGNRSDQCLANDKPDEQNCRRNPINPYIESRDGLNGQFLYKFENENVASLSSFLIRNEQSETKKEKGIVVVTDKSKIYRLLRDNDSLKLVDQFQFNSNVIIKQISPFVSKDSIYFTTGHFMIKYPLDVSSSSSSNYNRTSKIRKYKTPKSFYRRHSGQLVIVSALLSVIIILIVLGAVYKFWTSHHTKKEYLNDYNDKPTNSKLFGAVDE